MPVDFDRLGGLCWVQDTGDRLRFGDGARLLASALGTTAAMAAHLLTLAFRRTGRVIGDDLFMPPDSRVAREAEEAATDLSPIIRNHSYRTWMLGTALAVLDGRNLAHELDAELFFCASLLHDYGLAKPTKGRDFTLAGSEQAAKAVELGGRSHDDAMAVADGICVHPSVGISVRRDGAIGYYLQWGSMADIAGLRRAEVPQARLQEILCAHPRTERFKQEMAAIVSSEALAVPRGRFALYKHLGMTLATQWLVPDWTLKGPCSGTVMSPESVN